MPVSPISANARKYVRSRATGVMQYKARAERVGDGVVDDDSLVFSPGERTVIIEESVCRVWVISGAAPISIGVTDIDTQDTRISFPWDAPILKKDDQIEITFAPTQDVSMQGKRFEVVTASFAGELRATRSYSVKAVEK